MQGRGSTSQRNDWDHSTGDVGVNEGWANMGDGADQCSEEDC